MDRILIWQKKMNNEAGEPPEMAALFMKIMGQKWGKIHVIKQISLKRKTPKNQGKSRLLGGVTFSKTIKKCGRWDLNKSTKNGNFIKK